ncbi:alpha/beta hydrolase [Occallatibacter riparius]|uniref:Alpha/beta hydrolase n=1 Tax=Occallatibacter riparius TaxID=1002689 RepID=A0A9J7BGR3_9BACT|nr:lysophospholipase [Occallatibacter riparius]UWZ81976.1 alpha/beta hydrolase [Occallatibacter riparius]
MSLSTTATRPNSAQRFAFRLALACGSRAIQARDRVLGRMPRRSEEMPGLSCTPLVIESGSSLLDAAYVEPASGPIQASVLICHGIGEVVRQWIPIQQLLAARGVASLVFDYSGYGRSTGRPEAEQLERDAVSAFRRLRELAPPRPLGVLGFSLGSGIAAAVLSLMGVDRLVLCAGFPSFREAARSVGVPPFLEWLVPPIWSAEASLRGSDVPVLVVHSTHDRLFPVRMAHDLVACCGPGSQSILVPGLAHNEPFYKPTMTYWNPIADFLIDPVLPASSQVQESVLAR